MLACPACKRRTLDATGFEVKIDEVLRRWEEVMGASFTPEIWSHYHDSTRQPVSQMRCTACGFGCFQPVVEGTPAFYKAITAVDYYVAGKWEFEQAIRELRYENVRRVLDVGCGSGHFLKLMRELEPTIELVGQEIGETIVDAEKYDIEMIICSPQMTRSTLAVHKKFDAITMFQVLEHSSDPLELLDSCARSLRPGGILMVSTPDAQGPVARFTDALTEIPPHHLTQWTEGAYRASLPRVGLEVLSVRREPLPHYLWDSYLPVLWDSNIWPAKIGRELLVKSNGSTDPIALAARLLREAGISHLHGVPGHTILIMAKRSHVA